MRRVDKLAPLLSPLFPHLRSRNKNSVLPQGASRRINEVLHAKCLARAGTHSVPGLREAVCSSQGEGKGLGAGLPEEEMPACTLDGK